ncbi:hypothetical protein B0J14DRAFT_570433 [Halenospora varia]|nr:hypothetical protein B0J14DRAFT_570433 [Halenospora varia]
MKYRFIARALAVGFVLVPAISAHTTRPKLAIRTLNSPDNDDLPNCNDLHAPNNTDVIWEGHCWEWKSAVEGKRDNVTVTTETTFDRNTALTALKPIYDNKHATTTPPSDTTDVTVWSPAKRNTIPWLERSNDVWNPTGDEVTWCTRGEGIQHAHPNDIGHVCWSLNNDYQIARTKKAKTAHLDVNKLCNCVKWVAHTAAYKACNCDLCMPLQLLNNRDRCQTLQRSCFKGQADLPPENQWSGAWQILEGGNNGWVGLFANARKDKEPLDTRLENTHELGQTCLTGTEIASREMDYTGKLPVFCNEFLDWVTLGIYCNGAMPVSSGSGGGDS